METSKRKASVLDPEIAAPQITRTPRKQAPILQGTDNRPPRVLIKSRGRIPIKTSKTSASERVTTDEAVKQMSDTPAISSEGSPWSHYKPLMDRLEAPRFTVAQHLESASIVSVAEVRSEQGERVVQSLRKLSHVNIYNLKEFFEYEDSCFLVSDYMRLSLKHLLALHLQMEEGHIRLVARSV